MIALALLNADAIACGGFFCSQTDIDQSGEEIVFAATGDTITTHVQISYEGAAQDFAWVVPVPSEPEIFLSTETLFQLLSGDLTPRYWTQWRDDGACEWDDLAETDTDTDSDTDADADFDTADSGDAGVGVEVIAKKEVGPYDSVVLKANSADALVTWLTDNAYVLPPSYVDLVEPYVAGGNYFVGLRLQNGKSSGDIQPLAMTFDAKDPMIPVVLTAIAAKPDMRIRAHVLGQHRAVPENYLHVHVNDARVNWLEPWNVDYDGLVTEAADQAGGHAFATDYSGTTAPLKDRLYREGRYNTDALATIDDPVEFLAEIMRQGFPADERLLALLTTYIPKPASLDWLDEQDFYNCLSCYEDEIAGQPFDPASFAADLEEVIVEPLRAANSLFDEFSTITRLSSSLSPLEMTIDPKFVFNADMGEVNNVRTATATRMCALGNGDPYASPIDIELPDGRTVTYPPNTDIEEFLDHLPAASVIEQTHAEGDPTQLFAVRNAIPGEPGAGDEDPRGAGAKGGCGCSTSAPVAGWLALLALPLVFRRK